MTGSLARGLTLAIPKFLALVKSAASARHSYFFTQIMCHCFAAVMFGRVTAYSTTVQIFILLCSVKFSLTLNSLWGLEIFLVSFDVFLITLLTFLVANHQLPKSRSAFPKLVIVAEMREQ